MSYVQTQQRYAHARCWNKYPIYARFLDHEDISVTVVYAKADNRLNNEAINKLAPKVIEPADLPDSNKEDHDLMDFLNSLK